MDICNLITIFYRCDSPSEKEKPKRFRFPKHILARLIAVVGVVLLAGLFLRISFLIPHSFGLTNLISHVVLLSYRFIISFVLFQQR